MGVHLWTCWVGITLLLGRAWGDPSAWGDPYVVSRDSNTARYEPTWESLDARPLPKWYDEAKFGIFLHWGVFSVPSFGSEWFWINWKSNSTKYVEFMTKNYPPGFSYQDFARDFTAEFWNASDWAELFASSGAKYVVLTSKHHEGYTLWPSSTSFSWNSQDVGPHRDLVGELAEAIRNKTDLVFGLYHSLYEWYNPLYLQDKEANFTTRTFVEQKTMPELHELISRYRPEVIWSDGDWEPQESYWGSREFLAWLYNSSPVRDTVVANDRWGSNIPCKHGDFYTCTDRFNPGVLQTHKWENCMTVDKKSWGFRRNANLQDYMTMEELVTELAQTVSCGGNLLMNVGPTKEGIISPIFEERLRGMGAWLKVNGEAIYGSKPWTFQNDTLTPGVWYTKSGDNGAEPAVYATVLHWPTSGVLHLALPKLYKEATVTMLGQNHDLQWALGKQGINVIFPNKATVTSQWAWVLKMSGVTN